MEYICLLIHSLYVNNNNNNNNNILFSLMEVDVFSISHMQIAAGMKSTFDIEIYAMAVGVIGESGVGAVRHILEIITETSILHLPITANILLITLTV